jgi:hypothetical protein
VEVIGTTSTAETIVLTRNEVSHARKMASRVALFITCEVELDQTQEPPVANGGRDVILDPWDL